MSATIPSERTAFETIAKRISSTAAAQKPQSQSTTIAAARNEIFRLSSIVGRMASAFLTVSHDSGGGVAVGDEIANLLGEVFIQMLQICRVCGIDLRLSVLRKMELNGRKYPVELCKVGLLYLCNAFCCLCVCWFVQLLYLCSSHTHIMHLTMPFLNKQGKSGKYTKYSQQTGITKTEGQSTLDNDINNISFESNESEQETDTDTIEGVTLLLRQFALDRLWNRYHTPRNIALALIGEVGELAELFQWSDDVDNIEANGQIEGLVSIGWKAEEVDKVGQEIADVTIYLMRLADVCGVSLGHVSSKLLV
jgi:dCTP diphosphatase